MSKIETGWLDQYGAGPSEQQQFGTACVERVNDCAEKVFGKPGELLKTYFLCHFSDSAEFQCNARLSRFNKSYLLACLLILFHGICQPLIA